MKFTQITPKTEARIPNKYPVVKREIKRTARTKMGEAKVSLLETFWRRRQQTTALAKIRADVIVSRMEKGK